MKTYCLSLTFGLLALGLSGAAGAEGWTVQVRAVNGRVTYSHAQRSPVSEQTSYAGKARMRGMGPEREIIFNSYLHAPEDGQLRLDYQVELAGELKGRPPFQAQGKVLLRPGKPVLAVEAGGWKLILELQGTAKGKATQKETGVLETSLKCGRASYQAKFVYLPEEQYDAVLYSGTADEPVKFMVGLLPNITAMDGNFMLQYTLQLKEGGETLVSNQGQLSLEPGGGRRTAAAGKGCVFSAKALR